MVELKDQARRSCLDAIKMLQQMRKSIDDDEATNQKFAMIAVACLGEYIGKQWALDTRKKISEFERD